MKNRQRKKMKEKRTEKNQEIVQNYELISHFMLAFLIYLLKKWMCQPNYPPIWKC